ncbi:MAG: glycosyltransferase [Kordiimonas sp.]
MAKLTKKRIAYLTGEYPKVSHTFIQREVAELRALGLEVSTCTVRRPPLDTIVGEDQNNEAKNTFCILENARAPHRVLMVHLNILARQPKHWFAALALAWKTRAPGAKNNLYQLFYFLEAGILAHFLIRQKVEHLHDHFGSSSCTVVMLASKMINIPFSFTIHGPDIFYEPRRWAIDEKIAQAHFAVCISKFCRSQAMLFSHQKYWNKLKIVHCGVELERYSRARQKVPSRAVLFVGRLAAIKGVSILLDAFREVVTVYPDAILTLIGDGPERAALEAQVDDLGISHAVNFIGYRDQESVAEYLAQSSVLVLPSFAEGVPVVLMEALASSIPVIATQVAGVSELVKHGENGFIVPPSDTNLLAKRLEEVISDPVLSKKMGEEGRNFVEAEFNIKRQAEVLFGLLTEG